MKPRIRKNMHKGFSLIEVVVAIALASIIVTLLYSSLKQTTRVVRTVDVLVDRYYDMSLLNERFFKDLSGSFIPEKKAEQPKPVLPGQQEKKQEEPKKEEAWVLTGMDTARESSEGRSLTFLTTNPLHIYNETKPRLVRVLYEIVPDEKNKAFWNIVRYESVLTSLADMRTAIKEKKIRGYTVLTHSAQLRMEAVVAKDAEKKEYERVSSWQSDDRAREKKKEIPDYVEISGTLHDERKKRDITFEWYVPIFAEPVVAQAVPQPAPMDEKKKAEEQTPGEKKITLSFEKFKTTPTPTITKTPQPAAPSAQGRR